MTEQHIREKFLDAYDTCADDIFAACYEKIAERDIAQFMTKTIFMKTWDFIRSTGSGVSNMTLALRRTTDEYLKGFSRGKSPQSYSEKIWNLTLSQ